MQEELSYIIISAVRDEGKYIEKTIKCVISQTIKPLKWVIVNDGSSDNTGEIIDEYTAKYAWIKSIHRQNRGFRKAGGGVIEAFYDAYDSLPMKNWDFIVKMDGDLIFDDNYFERCFEYFRMNAKLGIGGGVIHYIIDGKEKEEKTPIFHVRGATKIYRVECWEAIGGLIKAPGWDTIDEVKANMLGWETRSFSDIKIIHQKYTGSADGTMKDLIKHGVANYIAGYHPLFMCIKCLKRTIQKPYLVGSFLLLFGFIKGYIQKIPQIDDKELINYIRQQQLRKLLLRKSIWN